MKFPKATRLLFLALFLFLLGTVFIGGNREYPVPEPQLVERVETVRADSLTVKDNKNTEQAAMESVSLLDHNFLFNLIYEFAYGELVK